MDKKRYEFTLNPRIKVGELSSNQKYEFISVIYTNSWQLKIVAIGQPAFATVEVMEELNNIIDFYSQKLNTDNLMVINLRFDTSTHLKSGNGASNFSMVFAYGDLVRLIE
ncbi:hypothetical protein [Carnobacterium inhibens]|uniref:Uncharacterized protein n=1 Tax=Carnobacterium inhibens TaxID=147709 RepID=A0ABR7TFM6_9LACT|nr:hypothetical protein [Carnobacterium inhibens]MBC9826410.1 hypothetical protein [Carnobacterium inhibens]